MPETNLDIDTRLLPWVSALVPERKRAEWQREWQAELWHLRHAQYTTTHVAVRTPARDLASAGSLAWGLIADAAWLRWDGLCQSLPGSAEWCLVILVSACLCSAAIDRALAGSWFQAMRMLAFHFLHSYVFVATPATIAAIATYPLKELRWERKQSRLQLWLSARARWNAFLAAKVILTLTFGFLATVAISVALRRSALLNGNWVDWFELIGPAPWITAGLRWALLNQEQRCQKCLRMLSQPTRIGPPSHNFLHWSGTELSCAEGHGLLHVPEMPGSWCWYDRWVELDAAFESLIRS